MTAVSVDFVPSDVGASVLDDFWAAEFVESIDLARSLALVPSTFVSIELFSCGVDEISCACDGRADFSLFSGRSGSTVAFVSVSPLVLFASLVSVSVATGFFGGGISFLGMNSSESRSESFVAVIGVEGNVLGLVGGLVSVASIVVVGVCGEDSGAVTEEAGGSVALAATTVFNP